MRTTTQHTRRTLTSKHPEDRTECLRRSIEHSAHLLPAQGPITVFVHHNTLHALEDLPFERAVVEGARIFDCHPFLPEERYRRELARGRIRLEDVEAVLMEDLGDDADVLLGFLGTRFHLRRSMIGHALRIGPSAELQWVLTETEALRKFHEETPRGVREAMINETRRWVTRDLLNGGGQRKREMLADILERYDSAGIDGWSEEVWEAFCLDLLWRVCSEGVRELPEFHEAAPEPMRHRDWLLAATGEDSDELVHELLIRFCSAFLDQGFGHWSQPEREAGFYRSFLGLYSRRGGPPDAWLRGLRAELLRQREQELEPLESIEESLRLLGVEEDERRQTYIRQTLLALRGFAGMIWQLETRGDRVARPAPAGTLAEFLAVRLILERLALAHVAWRGLGFRGPLAELRQETRRRQPPERPVYVRQRAFLVFQLAQLLGWSPESLSQLSREGWTTLVRETDSFSSLERRRILHLAYERRYRQQTLDAVAAHGRPRLGKTDEGPSKKAAPSFQIACCIDEREESFRRHLEEIAPTCETFGAAGFFAVAIYYRGAADAHYTPLCPVIIKPDHYVAEDVVYSLEYAERRRRKTRRTIGTVTHRVHAGSRTFAGGWLAGLFGSLASIPLVMRILFPRATAQIRRVFGSLVQPPAVTKLELERSEELPGPENGHIGYSMPEMATIVERLLRDMGLTTNFSRLVIITGHGSASLNNPHEAAHDCGACGGGRGGPNARAFAQMANDIRVRERLAANGLRLPEQTVFVGAYHNTCDDSMTYYDLDRLPTTHKPDFERASEAIDLARQRSAHERCRRFESAPLRMTPEAALRHVEGRAEDLSQVRPEYGHATNALCFVGRRQWSRGLFLDRRAFLQSYDPAQDDEQRTILTRILQAVIPVCAGINLEYYFSFVDPTGYGCGTKLPHNIVSLIGVMNGAASDLRPGLPWQMTEIHEPVRLLFVIETTPEAMLRIMEQNEGIQRLVRGGWVQLATLDPDTGEIRVFRRGAFERYRPEITELPQAASSADWYRGWRDHLGFATIEETRTT